MAPLPHRIRRLSVHARAGSAQAALALRAELRGQAETALIAALERAFDEAGSGDEIVHVPRLDIRLHLSSTGDLAGELGRRVEEEIRKELSAARTASRPAGAAAGEPAAPGLGDSASPPGAAPWRGDGASPGWGGAPADTTGTASLRTPGDMLLHYLETGSLPWPLANLGAASALSELRAAAAEDAAETVGRLSGQPTSLPEQVAFWMRWLQLLGEDGWPALARAASESSPGTAGAPLEAIVGALSGPRAGALPRYARLHLAAAAIAVTRNTGYLTDPEALAAVVLHALGGAGGGAAAGGPTMESGALPKGLVPGGEGPGLSFPAEGDSPAPGPPAASEGEGEGARPPVLGASPKSEGGDEGTPPRRRASALSAGLPEPARAAFLGWLAGPRSRHETATPSPSTGQSGADRTPAAPVSDTKSSSVERSPRDARSEPPSGQALWPASPTTRAPAESAFHSPRPDARQGSSRDGSARAAPLGQMVHHAGLVLLHPFLPRFFESTGVKEAGKQALLEGEIPRAAALLHLLATGEGEVFELGIDFIKVLLGVPLGAHLPVAEGLLRDSDPEETEALIGAVIGHWGALKSTSNKGFRGSFLQRRGLLREEEQGFRLQVEPAPFDMLLGHLPWGIATIKLPWMKKVLFTEWQAP